MKMDYIAYTDESNISGSRFQSLSVLSFHRSYSKKLKDKVISILKHSDVHEFKWTKVKDAKYTFCAEKLINLIMTKLSIYNIRVDTIMWDTHDSRHQIERRDDHANYERMFFHLLSNSMKRRPKKTRWHIRPDQRHGINWAIIRDCLSATGNRRDSYNTLFGKFFSDPYYKIESFSESCSKEEIPIQIADLFSGMAVFSRTSYYKFKEWKKIQTPSLFTCDEISLTNREKYRFKLLDLFNNQCKSKKLGVSLNQKKCLYTINPKKPLNFWFYEPQHDLDKAPIKK